jgi:hypothetical protein
MLMTKFPVNSVGRGALDDNLPGSRELLSSPVPAPVLAVIEAAGSTLTGLEAVQSSWWPTKQLTVRYKVTARGGMLDGHHQIVATAGKIPQGAAHVEGPDGTVGVWIVPNDPLLPGLVSALDLTTVSQLVRNIGVDTEIKSLRFRAYRPGRRGVVEAVGPAKSLFLKVVRPNSARSLHEKHRHLASRMPVPDSLGFSRELGVVVLPAISGQDMRRALSHGGKTVPVPGAVAALIESLPRPLDDRVTKSPIDKLPRIVDLLSRILPDEARRLDRLVADIGSDDRPADVPVHGDFYEAQILVADARPVGLIDVDTFGWGRPADDPAMMLGHLTLLASSAENPASVLDYASRLQALWEAAYEPADLRRRIAAVVLGQATGPFRVQRNDWPAEVRQRIDTAEGWVESSSGRIRKVSSLAQVDLTNVPDH